MKKKRVGPCFNRHGLQKTWRIMRLSAIMMLFFGLTLSAETSEAQKRLENLIVENATILDVFRAIEAQSDYGFFFKDDQMDLEKRYTLNLKNTTIEEALAQIFSGKDYTYQLIGENVVVMRRDAADSFTSAYTNLQQQGKTITGTVVDAYGGTIPGASIVVKGTTNGTITDMDGNFTLAEVPEDATLSFSFVGMKTVEVQVVGQTSLNIVLLEETLGLDEVVVIGYGAVRKADLAGSVSVLDSKNFRDQPITRISEAFQGRTPGVEVVNSNVPGGSIKIRVRGSSSINRSNDPLYVVDGIVRESGLDGINTDDIQSIQVLKDASSTAIYGSRGSNGVVMITTKTGNVGERLITFDAQISTASVYKTYDILSPFEYATAYREIKNPNAFTEQEMTAYKNGTAGIDWQDEIFRTGVTQNYKIALSSGNKNNTQYYISGNYMGQEGIVDYTSSERYQARTNITSNITNWLHITADVNVSHNIRKGKDFTASKENPIWVALNYSPTMEMMDDQGNYNRDPYNAIANNPKGDLALQGGENISDIINGRIDLRFNILPGLTFTSTNGVDNYDAKGYSFATERVSTKSSMGNSETYRRMLQSSNNITYTGNWGDHSLIATGVYEATQTEGRGMSFNGTNLLTESVGWWDVNMASTHTFNNNYYEWSLMSGVGRVIYNFKDKYLLTGTIRADGSSKFTNDKWGYFPSIAAAWTLSNENFMQNQKLFQDIKIRSSYGVVGNQAIEPYGTLGLMSRTSYSYGGTSNFTGYWSNAIATPDLTWEKTRQFDLGLDLSMLNYRLSVSADYFNKRTEDGLLQKQIPNYDGGGNYWVNAGEISNKGFDLSLTGRIIQSRDLNWSSTINGTYLKNEVLSLGGDEFLYGTTPAAGMSTEVTIIKIGEPIGSFYGYLWEGFDAQGNNVYTDLNKNGSIDAADRTVIGKSTPDYTLGWNNQLSWKNWDLNLFFNGAFGAKKLNMLRFTMASMVGDSRFITLRDAYTQGFDKVGGDAKYPSLTSNSNRYEPASTQWLESADYLRLENLSVSYNLAKSVTKFADMRLTLSSQNLFTISGYKGMDPTSSAFSSDNVDINSGIDMGAYPTPRTFTFGVRMNF